MYKIHFSKNVLKFLKTREAKFREKVVHIFERIAHDPYCNVLDIKPIQGKKIVID